MLAVGPVLDVSIEEAQSAFSTNFFSVLRLTKAVVPHMASRSTPGTKGLVVNIGSITAIVPVPWGGVYASTKAAIRSVSETMHMEFQPLGVRVLLVEPGGIRSNVRIFSDLRFIASLEQQPRCAPWSPLHPSLESVGILILVLFIPLPKVVDQLRDPV